MRRTFFDSSRIFLSVSTLVPALLIAKHAECEVDNQRPMIDKKQTHEVAMYLTPASRGELQSHLKKLGIEGDLDTSRVVVRRSCNSDDSYYYEPLFGEKAAFRLKGIIKTSSGSIAVRIVDSEKQKITQCDNFTTICHGDVSIAQIPH